MDGKQPPTTLHLTQAKRIAAFFVAKGLPLYQACGFVAQSQGESAFDPKAVGDKGHAFGLFQLHPDRAFECACG